MQENISEFRLHLGNTDDVLSAAGHPRQHNRPAAPPRAIVQQTEEVSALNQPIRLTLARSGLPSTCPVTIHECLKHWPDARDHIRAREKERYG